MRISKKALERNIIKLGVFNFLNAFTLILPIMVLFFYDLGLNLAQIMLLQSIFSVTLIVLEIPSGFLSDVWGRKKTLVAGSAFAALGTIIYASAFSFWALAIGEIVLAIGGSFLSGTITAILYDTLINLKKEDKFKKIEGRMGSVVFVSEGAAALVGGALALIFLRLPFIVWAFTTTLMFFVSLTLKEPKFKKFEHKRGKMYGLYKIVRFALYKNKEVKWMILYGSVIGTGTYFLWWFLQPYFINLGMPMEWYGVIFFLSFLSIAGASVLAHKIEKKLSKRWTLVSFLPATLVALLLMVLFKAYWVLPIMFLLLAYVRGTIKVIIPAYINKITWSDKRATVMSVQGLVSRLSFALLGPFIGWVADVYTVQQAFLMVGVIVGVFGILTLIFLAVNKILIPFKEVEKVK